MDTDGSPGPVESPLPVGKVPGGNPFVKKCRKPLDEQMVDPGTPLPSIDSIDPFKKGERWARTGNEFHRRIRP